VSPAGGVRRYVNGLVSGLRTLSDPPSLILLGGRDPARLPDGLPHVAEPPCPPTNLGWMLVGLPWAARRAAVDVVHAPAYTAPFFAPAPVVLTVHDVSYERHPEWYPYRRDILRRAFYRRSALSAAHIITVSEFSAREIRAAYGLPASRITVIPHGIDPGTIHSGDGVPLPPGVSEPFLLHVGDLHERRNLGVIVDALAAARGRDGLANLTLVLAGVDRGHAAVLLARAQANGGGESVRVVGPVSEAELGALYRRARALTYPSLYEGFGLPVLEAMAAGTPVLASRAASMPEVLGDAGVLIEPQDVRAWTEAIVRVATDDAWRRNLAAAGEARAATFTWSRAAAQTLDVFRQVVAP
jgi:glycosyltransferase involved in cell wall biosynthesis